MKGSLKQRSKGSWQLRWYVRDESGKRVPRSETVRGTRREAEARLAQILHELNTGISAAPGRLTVGEYLDRWVTEYAESHWSASTLRPCKSYIRNHLKPALGQHPLARLTPLHVQGYYTRQRKAGKLSEQTLLHHHRILHQALAQAVRWQLLARNVMDGVTAPRPRPEEPHAFTEAQVAQLLAGARGTPLYLPILLALSTGMRRGEALGLFWEDVDLKAGTLVVRRSQQENGHYKEPKSGKARVITLPAVTVDILAQHKEKGATSVCGPMRCDTVTKGFAKLARELGLPSTRFHDLRHTFASQMFRLGVAAKTVAEMLGHSDTGITLNRYTHMIPGIQEEAAHRMDEALRAALGDQGSRVFDRALAD